MTLEEVIAEALYGPLVAALIVSEEKTPDVFSHSDEQTRKIATAVRAFMGSEEVVERVARASFVFRHQGDIADPGKTWDAPDKSEHPLYWKQKMEHNHPHYRAMARAALSSITGAIDNGR